MAGGSDILEVSGLEVRFQTERGDFPFLNDVSFSLKGGEILGIVGESGSGKSITCMSVMQLLDRNGSISKGSIRLEGEELLGKTDAEMDKIRGRRIGMIFQDAMGSLNPVFTIGRQICESLRVHLGLSRKASRSRALAILRQVGLPDPHKIMRSYPYMLSGGMQQRVMIAIALACDPSILIADEPTTALDVTIQAQIMNLIRELKQEIGMSVILITHDIALIAEMANRVLVMYAGQVLEETDVYSLFERPAHPYTQLLLATVPDIGDDPDRELIAIKGTVPEHYEMLSGCRFYNRCPYARESCRLNEQRLVALDQQTKVRCQRALAGEIPRRNREEARANVQ